MNKTIYVSAKQAKVFDEARELAGGKLSPVIVKLLEKWIRENDPKGTLRKRLREVRGRGVGNV